MHIVTLNWGAGNIGDDLVNDNPLFADADNDDYHLLSQAGRWNPDLYRSSDFSADGIVNLIDFADFASSWSLQGQDIPADLNRDDIVDMSDLCLFAEKYLTSADTGGWLFDGVTSPCIDAGNPGCPLGDEPVGSDNVRINMGAYGGTAQASKTPANWASLADLTNDHKVDFTDLLVFVQYWLDDGQCIPGDLNRNESVNFADFTFFADQWLWEK